MQLGGGDGGARTAPFPVRMAHETHPPSARRRYISLIGAPNLDAPDAPSKPSDSGNSSGSGSGTGRRLGVGGGYIWPSGLSSTNFDNNFGPAFSSEYDFATCLALFFPCFTGASALKEPTGHPDGGGSRFIAISGEALDSVDDS